MIPIKIGNNFFEISEVEGQDASMTKIDWLAMKFYETDDKEYVNVLISVAMKSVLKVARKFHNNPEDARDLSQELKIKLVKWIQDRKWDPEKGVYFNYLMRRQLYNFSCNIVRNSREPLYTDITQVRESLLLDGKDFVKVFEAKDLVEKLMSKTDDHKIKDMLNIMLRGVTNCEKIGEELGITGMAVRNRIKKCKQLVQQILEE